MYDIFVAEQLVSLNVDNQREKFHRLWMKTFMCINPERCSAADAKSEYLFRQRGDSFVVFSTIKAQKQLLSDLERYCMNFARERSQSTGIYWKK